MVPRFSWSSMGVFVLVGVALLAAVEAGPVDCRRFVFAPACRGATIKRSRPVDVAVPRDVSDVEAFEQYSQQGPAPEEATQFDEQQRPLKGRHWAPLNRHRQPPVQLESDD